MLRVLEQYFADQNAFALAQSPARMRSESLKSNAQRRWQLHVWTLSGAPSTWDDQLNRLLAREPVYAVISGLGGKDWRPVHEFCERASLPCIFPNLDLPVVAEQDFYPLYFSKGVLLEAELIAKQLSTDSRVNAAGRVLQIFRPEDIGAQAAAHLKALATSSGSQSLELPLGSSRGSGLTDVLRNVRQLQGSGLMGGLENTPLPPDWRQATRLTYPAELPDRRLIGSEFAVGWMRRYQIPVLDAQVQVNTYVACGLVMETLKRMQGSFTADYLVERIEGMLEHQLVSGYFPSLALAPNERFASKGGYIVHFAGPTGTKLVPDTEWRVP
jgi:hypothetical protein